ncbi:uncharacterized protein LOC108040724 [Drosophila rhopaloa]|uniref:Uncharacterized protein LOC108040724 n=1 Tax=Drosophila rhopaloa TaxID=1041015 RepID=A0A6P4EFJ7_DRORH|nr:uncharacterized protein LOC108040724 [Drosophila rhopaloa]
MEQIRVVVQLSDTKSFGNAAESAGEHRPGAPKSGREQQSPETFQYGGQVSVLDEHSLRLVYCQNASNPHLLLAQRFHFDVLGTHESGDEIATLLTYLFVGRRDGFLMHLRVNRECHLMFLLDTLVIQVRLKLQREGLHLDHGIVRFRKLLEEEDGRSGSGNRLPTERSFSDIHGLMLWLLNQYRMRAGLSTGPGHEALEVEYVVSSQQRHIQFSVRLHVLLVAMVELSESSSLGLRWYFRDDQMTSPVVATELVSFMLHISKGSRGHHLYMPVLVHVVATDSQVDSLNAQLLSLAHLVGRQNHHQPEILSSPSSIDHLGQMEVQQQEIHDRFQLVHASLMQYILKVEQLKSYRQRFDDQLAQFEELLKQTAHTEFGQFLRVSQASLDHINNLMEKTA